MSLLEAIAKKRSSLFTSVADFSFNKKRVKIISEVKEISSNRNAVLYWMSRDQRVQGKLLYLYSFYLNLSSFVSQIIGLFCSLRDLH